MRGWLLFHHELDPSIPEVPEVFRFQEAAALAGIDLRVLRPQLFDLIVGANGEWTARYEDKHISKPDFVICRTGAETDYPTLALLRNLERRGIRLINGSATIEVVADKLHTIQELARAGLPVPRTMLARFPVATDIIEREFGFPVIVKTLRGTRGDGVLKCENRLQFEDLSGLLASADAQADFILQHYIRASHGRDVRVLVVGGRVVAAMERRSVTGGFKSNVSLGGVGAAYNPPEEMVELAVRAAEALDLDITGVDILFDEDGYRICEANSSPGFQGLEAACGIDVPSAILSWIIATQRQHRAGDVPGEENALVDIVYGGLSQLRALSDGSLDYRTFARRAGLRMIGAGVTAIAHAILPSVAVDRFGPKTARLRSLYESRATNAHQFLVNTEQEQTLIIVLAVAIWTAVLPWLTGADHIISGSLSMLSLIFPIVFLLTTPKSWRKSDSAETRSGDGA